MNVFCLAIFCARNEFEMVKFPRGHERSFSMGRRFDLFHDGAAAALVPAGEALRGSFRFPPPGAAKTRHFSIHFRFSSCSIGYDHSSQDELGFLEGVVAVSLHI